ncbi:hypothetical protein G7Y89_g15155 [Cudoniella acicularis]|uniref:Uncharacterized protein n=1 Tax=Cudoniella acicularis TaxID=354080 RepID=A0A8H4QSW3_9HELO|nr:hypothetical protein G7Y89_g15155 [Cudoniella acicularis]
MTLGVIPKGGPSPLDLYTSHQEAHERIAVGLKRTECPSPKEPIGKGEEFEWLRQFKAFGPRDSRRHVQILQIRDEDEEDGDDERES